MAAEDSVEVLNAIMPANVSHHIPQCMQNNIKDQTRREDDVVRCCYVPSLPLPSFPLPWLPALLWFQ